MTDLVSLLFYIFIFSLTSLFFFLGGRKKYSRQLSALFVSIGVAIPTVVAGIRYDVGSDFLDYERLYDYATSNSYADFNFIFAERSVEPSLYFMSNVSSFLVQSSSIMFALYTAVTIIFFYLSARYFSAKWAWLSLFVFLCVYFPIGLSGMRQFAAMAIFLFSIRYIIEKKFTKYVLCTLVAALFHQTSLILLPVYFLGRYFLKNRTGWLRLIPLITFGFLLVATPVVSFALSLPIFSRYGYVSELERSSTYIGGTYVMQMLILIISGTFFSRLFKRDETYRVLFPMFMTGVVLYGIGFSFSSGWRLSLYMLPIAALLTPGIVDSIKGRMGRYVPLMVILFAIAYFVAIYFIAGNFDIFPYKVRGEYS